MTLTAPLFSRLDSLARQYPFVKRNFSELEIYERGFSLNIFMPINSVGIVTARDSFTIDLSREELWARICKFAELDAEKARQEYKLGKDVRDWQVVWAQQDVKANLEQSKLVPLAYRPFDSYWTFYTGKSRGFLCYPREDVMRHFLAGDNFGLLTTKAHRDDKFAHVSVCQTISEVIGLSPRTASNSINFPLYLYPPEMDPNAGRRINFDPNLYEKLQQLANHPDCGTPNELAVFDYLYGVLHCPAYRETYAEFLKIDFPRIPWPASPDEFWDVSQKGAALRTLHLMDPAAIGATPYPFTGDGDNRVDKPRFDDGKVWINNTQYFASTPEVSWSFYIGGYQPAQKWLKDRKGRALSFDDVKHYQRILKILAETDRIMRTIAMTLT